MEGVRHLERAPRYAQAKDQVPPVQAHRALEAWMPWRANKRASSSQSKPKENESHMTEVMTAEVVTIQDNHDKHEHVWQLFSEAGSKTVSWKTKVDVQKEGFSDTHATGNQQRSVKDHGQHEEIETAVATEKKKGPMLKGETEIFQTCSQGEQDVLSAEGSGFSSDELRSQTPRVDAHSLEHTRCGS